MHVALARVPRPLQHLAMMLWRQLRRNQRHRRQRDGPVGEQVQDHWKPPGGAGGLDAAAGRVLRQMQRLCAVRRRARNSLRRDTGAAHPTPSATRSPVRSPAARAPRPGGLRQGSRHPANARKRWSSFPLYTIVFFLTSHVAHGARRALETLSPRLRIVTLDRRRPGHSRGGCTTGAARFRATLEKPVKRRPPSFAGHSRSREPSARRSPGGGGSRLAGGAPRPSRCDATLSWARIVRLE
jgi:hypothetical protein